MPDSLYGGAVGLLMPCTILYQRYPMKLREGTSGRVQPIPGQYLSHPSTCCMCARPPKNTEEPFLNLGVELDYFGFLYLCTDCATEIAESIGAIPYERYQDMGETLIIREAELSQSENSNLYLRGLLDARISAASRGVIVGHGTADVLVPKDESGQDDVDEIINGLQPVVTESGTK